MTEVSPETVAERRPGKTQLLTLVVFIALCFSVAATGAFFPPNEWYASLNPPGYAPPNWVFGPVWSVLYLMIAVSGWLVWKSPGAISKRTAFVAFGAQLLLNAGWSALFFGLRSPGWALVEICLLWLAILTTIVLFRSHSKTAALLLVPYLAWVSFAAVLNFGFWSMNR